MRCLSEDYAMLRDQWVKYVPFPWSPGLPSKWFPLPRAGQGFILVYSITSRSAFDRVRVFYESVRHIKGGDPILVLVGNKADKAYDREVSKEEGGARATVRLQIYRDVRENGPKPRPGLC